MIEAHLKITAGLLSCVLAVSAFPAEALAAAPAVTPDYTIDESAMFSAGAVSAINGTVVVLEDEDDTLLADGETDVTENEAPVVADPEPEAPVEEETTPEQTPEAPVNEFANIGIANVREYLNIRKEPQADAEVLGKMYPKGAATVLEQVGDWYKITSGNVTGYVASKFLVVGDEAACKAAATMTAKITTNSLRVRKKASTDSKVLITLGKGQKVTVLDDSIDGWLQIKYKSYTGYISADYAEVSLKYSYAESKEEEGARIQKEKDEKRKKEEEKRKREEAAKKKQEEAAAKAEAEADYSAATSAEAKELVKYALKFVGGKYVWGGTSLTKGVDCSGFVMKVYEKFGYNLPHSSYDLRKVGKKVSASNIQPGDIVCYSGHVAIYIGGGKIVHASNKKEGIKITNNYRYKRVITIRRVL